MTISEQIICIANRLANEGKQPSVALVKAQLTEKAPLPLIISTLKNWQHQPERVIATNKEAADSSKKMLKNTEFSNEQLQVIDLLIIEKIQQVTNQLTDKINKLEQQVTQLTSKSS